MSDTPPQAEIYDTPRFEQLYYSSRKAPVENLGLAAKFFVGMSHTGHFPMAFFGGWAMYLRGSSRQTGEIDVAVNATMDYIKSILLQCARYTQSLNKLAAHLLI